MNLLINNKCFIKRLFDIVFSISFLIIFSPLYVIISIAILLFMGRPIFYVNERPGYLGKPFKLIKFRTMAKATSKNESDAERLKNWLGVTLRKTSLDEIPEFINVLKGEMSIVGPRPLLMEYLPLYSKEHFKRHDIRPGITGLAQVKGRNNLEWEDKFNYDVYYVNNYSLLLDIKILLLTIWKVLSSDGVSKNGCKTTSRFTGYDK